VASDDASDSQEDGKKQKHERRTRRNDSEGDQRRESRKEQHGGNESRKNAEGKKKPSREERGYTKARGKKDDWKKFFEQPEPDFSEEGWARRSPKKK
jgi:ATP-dependent RNA helicase DeaD